ncbi:MAG: hypothetical protein WBQ79_12300 [Acidobacteriaceae bacterium]
MARFSHLVRSASISAAVCLLSVTCVAETTFSTNPTRFLVCDKGIGSFTGKLPNFSSRSGVTVTVRATTRAGFAVRGCQASLNWGRGETLIASEASQADIDVMGADLGFGVPVVAFQIKATEADPAIKYEIYSLTKPAKMLRTITGQDYFSAADTRLDGTVEIWTTDAAAANGFDNLPRSAFDAAPTVVLRFEDEKLMDVSSEFRDHYDRQIDALRSQLDERQLSDFKASDGRLSAEHLSSDGQPTGLLATKVKVIEIVWAYLYSGREQQAWDALNTMWPASDTGRVRTAITNARAHGLRTQVDGVSQLTAPQNPSNHSAIYDHTASFGGYGMQNWQRAALVDSGPQQILLRLPSPNNPQHWDEERQLELVIDEAGKVRSARMADGFVKDISAGMRNEPGTEWIDDAAGWKYIPAFKDGRPKAFRAKMHVFRDR